MCISTNLAIGRAGVSKDARGFDHNLDAKVLPREIARIFFGKNFDGAAINDQITIHDFYGTGKDAVVRVVFKQMRIGLSIK